MGRPKRRSPTKLSQPAQNSEPAEEVSYHKMARGKKGKKAVDLRASTSDGAVEVGVGVKGNNDKKPPRSRPDDIKVRTSASENQVSIDVGLHRPKKGHESKRVKEILKEVSNRERVSPPSPPDPTQSPDDGDKARRRRKRAERGDGEKRSVSPEKPTSEQRNSCDAKQTPSPRKGSAEAKPDPTVKTHVEKGQAQKNTDTAAVGGFMGFVQNIVSFLTPAPPRKRRPGPKILLKRTSWQSGRPTRLRVSEKNMEHLRREAEAARKRNADKECVEVRQLFSTTNGKDDDKIEVLHSPGMRKRSSQNVKEETNQRNKLRKTTSTTRKKSPSKREDKDRDMTEFEKSDKVQNERKLSTGKKKRNLNCGENKMSNNLKKSGTRKHGVAKMTQRNKNNCSEQTFETTNDKNMTSDFPNEGVKRGQPKSVERSGHEHRGKQPMSTKTDPRSKSNVKQFESKPSPETSAQIVKKTPPPTRDAIKSDRNVAAQHEKSKGPDASEQALKSNVLPVEWVRETSQRGQCKRHKTSGRNASKHTPAPVTGITETDPNGERKRHKSQRKEAAKQRMKSTGSPSKEKRETDTIDGVKHKSQARDSSEHKAKSISSPAKGKKETSQNVEAKRPKLKIGDLSEHKVRSTTSPTKSVKETGPGVEKCPKSKARDAYENTAISTLAKGVEEIDQNEGRKRPKSKVRDASEHKVTSTPSPSKVTKSLDINDDNKQSKPHIDSKKRENKTRPRPAGHTVSVEVVTSFSNRAKEECRKKRSQSSGQPNDKPLTIQVTETPSRLLRQRQKLEKSKENMLPSTTDDETGTVYERPQKPRWIHNKERTGVDSKTTSKRGSTMKTSIQKTNQDKLSKGERKSLQSKKSVNSKSPCGKNISGTSNKVDDTVKADYNWEDKKNQKVNKDTELSPEENQESPCHGTKLSTHILRDIRNEAKRLGVTLTPKVDKFLAELKQSLIYSHLALTRPKSRHENEKKLSPKCSNTQKRSQSAAPETTSLKNTSENEGISNHPKHVKCHSSACLKKKNKRKWEAVNEISTQKVKSPTAKSLTKRNIKGEENADEQFQKKKSQVDSSKENNKVVESKDSSIQNNPLDGLGEELLNTLLTDRRLLNNLDALCEAIRTGKPYVGTSRSDDKKTGMKDNTMENANVNENWGGDMKSKPNTNHTSELSEDEPSEKTYSTIIECDICSIDVLPFEKKFARYLDDSYLERSAANAKKENAAEEPNFIKKASSDKEGCTPKLKSRKKRCSKDHAAISLQKKHLGKKLSCISITDSYKQIHLHDKGLQSRELYDDVSENKGDWIFRLTQPNSKHNDARCETKLSRDEPCEHVKEDHCPPSCTTRIFSCLVPSTTDPIWEREDYNSNDEREPVEQHEEVTEHPRSNRVSGGKIKPDSRDSSSGSASTAVVRPEIYSKADEIYRRIMVQKRLRGPQPNVLFSTILNKLLQGESSRIMAEEEQCLKRSKRRRDRFETDTCTTVSVRSSSRDQDKDDECSSLRQLCYDRTDHTERASKEFHSKLKRKQRGKCRSKTLQLSQEDVSNLLNDDFEKGSKKKRRLRTEDVLLSQVTESEECSLQKDSRDVNVDRDIKFCKFGHIENEKHVPELDNLCIQVYRETEDSSLFKRRSKTKPTYNKAVYKCRNKGEIDNSYNAPSKCSYQIQDDVESDDGHLLLASTMRNTERQNIELHKVKPADTLAMVSKQASSYSKMVQQTMNINGETTEDKAMKPKSKKRGDRLKEPKSVTIKESEKVRVNKASVPSGKSVEAESKTKHLIPLEPRSPLEQDNGYNYDFRFSVPAKELEISRRSNVPMTTTGCLETGSTTHKPKIVDKMASTKTKSGKYMDNPRNNYENGVCTSSKQESPPNISNQKGTERAKKTPKDRMKITDFNEKKPMEQNIMTNMKSVSPQKVAGYLFLSRQLNKELNSRQTSPCSKTSAKFNPKEQLKLQKTVPKQTTPVLTPRNPSPPQLQIIKQQGTLKKSAKGNVQYQSNFAAKMLKRNATAKMDAEKNMPISPRSDISETNKNNIHSSPVKVACTQPMTIPDTHKLTSVVSRKRAQSANKKNTFFPQLIKTGLPSLNKPIQVKNKVNPKRSRELACVKVVKPPSEISIVPTKVVTLPRVAKTPKVTNIYTVEIDQQPSNCGLEQENLNFTTGQKGKLKSQRSPIMQRSKSDINRTEVEKPTLRQRTNSQHLYEQYGTTIVPHKEMVPSKRTNDTSSVAGEMKPPIATSSGKNNVVNVQQGEESNTNNHEGFRTSPDPTSSVERGASVVVPRRDEPSNTSRETQQHNLQRSSGGEDCMDEASGQEMNSIRYQLPWTSLPKASIKNRGGNKISLPVTSRLGKLSYTPNRSKRSMAFENHDTIESVRGVELGKTRSRRQCSVGQMMAKVPSKMIKSRSFLDRPAFISVVRPPREDAITKKSASSKAPKGKVFASRMKIVPSQTRKVVDARAITAKISGLHEMQCRRSAIEDRSKTNGKVTCAVIKEYCLDDKNGSCFNTKYVERNSSLHKLPTSSCNPWKEAAEAKQIWWEKHGDKFEKKLSKTSQEIKYGETSSVNQDISPRDQSTKYSGPRDHQKRAPSNDHQKTELRQDANHYNGTQTLNQQEYHQHHCIEYVTNENKIHEYGCTEATDCVDYSADRIQIEDFNHRRQHEMEKDKVMWNVKQKIEPTERKYTLSDQCQTLARKPPVNNCERELNDPVKREKNKNVASVTNNSINSYSRSRTWHGSPTNFVKRNIIASSQVKSIAERNRAAANKYVEKWKQHVDGSNLQCQPQSAAQADVGISTPVDISIARCVEKLDGRKRPDKEDILTSRSLQHEHEKSFDKNCAKIRIEMKKETLCNVSALNQTVKRREVAQPNNTGAVPKYREDKANRLEQSCLSKCGTRSDSEGSFNLPMTTCDFSYGYTPVEKQHDANVRRKVPQVEYLENEMPHTHGSLINECYTYPSHRKVAHYESSEEQFKHCKKHTYSQGKKPETCSSTDESNLPNVDSGAFGRCKKQTDSHGKKPKACGSEDESDLPNVDSGAFDRCRKQTDSHGKKSKACGSEDESDLPNVGSGVFGRCRKQTDNVGKKPKLCGSEDESDLPNVDSGVFGRCRKPTDNVGKKPKACGSEDESGLPNVDSGVFGRCRKKTDSHGKKPKACGSEDESDLPNVDSGAFGRWRKQTDSHGKKHKACGSEDEPDLPNVDSGALGGCGKKNRDGQKSHGVYLSEDESESASGSNHSDADYSDSGNSVNSCCSRSIENDSSCCISVCTSNSSQEDSCKGVACTSDESAFTAASEGSCYIVDDQSSICQDYLYSDTKSNDSPEQGNYSLEYEKGEIHQGISSKVETIQKVSSPIHVGDTINVGDLYGNGIGTPNFKLTSSSNKKIGAEEEVTLITPSSENLLAHAVGSKKLSREQNSIKEFYKTVQIPHGPSPSSMRIHHVPEKCQKINTFGKTTRGGHSPDIIPFTREHVTRMPTILSENNARAMKRDLEGSPVSRPSYPCRQRVTKPDRPKHESSRGLNPALAQASPPQPQPPPLRLSSPQTMNRNQTLIGKKSTPTQTDSRELGRNTGRFEGRMLHSKDETVFNIQDTSSIVGSHIRGIKSSLKDKEPLALRTGFKKRTEKGGGTLNASARPSEINDQIENYPINSEGKSKLTDTLSGESHLHCFDDERLINSKAPQNTPAKNIDKNIRKLEKDKQLTTNISQNNIKSKQKHLKSKKVSNRHKETVDQLRKFFEHSKETIEQLELMLSDTEKKNAKRIHVTPDRQPTDHNLTSNQETVEVAQINHIKHDEKTSSKRAKQDSPNDSYHPSNQSLEEKNVNFIKAPSIVGDIGSSYSSSTCSFECSSDKHAGIPSNYVYKECGKQTNPNKSKHAEETVQIAKDENKSSLVGKIISCSKNNEKDEKTFPDISSKTNETISGPKQPADEYLNASKIAGDDKKEINTTAPSNSGAINMVYKNACCKPIAPSEEVIAASCDKNTQLFQLLTRNLDGNGSGKNYLIINNCLKEIVVTVDESGFKLAAKSSGEEDKESISELNDPVISRIILPQESETTNESHQQKSAQTGDSLKGNLSEHKRKEFAKSTMSSSNKERSTKRTKLLTMDRQELARNTSPQLVNSRNVQNTDIPFSQTPSTSRELQDVGNTSTRSCVDQRNSGGWVKSSEFSSIESGGKSIEKTPTDRSMEESNHIMTTRIKSCLDEPWSIAANVNSSTSRSAAVPAPANKEWSANESTSKSSSGKSAVAATSSSLSFIDVENRKSLVKPLKNLSENQAVVLKTSPADLYSTKTLTSNKSAIKPEQSIMNEKPINNAKEIVKKKLNEHSKSSKPKIIPTSNVDFERNAPGSIKLGSSSGEALTLQTFSTMSFVDRSTPVTSNRSSSSSVKEHILAEDNENQTTTNKREMLVKSKSITRRQAMSESRKAYAGEVQRTGKINSSTSSGSIRSERVLGGSSHKDLTSRRHRSDRKEKATSKKQIQTTNEKQRQSEKHEKSLRKRQSKDVASHGKERNNEDPKDILSILYETDKRVFDDAKRSYTESVSNNEEDQMTDFERPLSERSLSDSSTKRKKKKKHSKEKEPPEVVSRRQHRKSQSSNKKRTKNDPGNNVKNNDPRATHKLFTQVGRWIGKKIDKI